MRVCSCGFASISFIRWIPSIELVKDCKNADWALYGLYFPMHKLTHGLCKDAPPTLRRLIVNGESYWDTDALDPPINPRSDLLVGPPHPEWPIHKQVVLPFAAIALWEFESYMRNPLPTPRDGFAIHVSSHNVKYRNKMLQDIAEYLMVNNLPKLHIEGKCAASHSHIEKVDHNVSKSWSSVPYIYARYKYCVVIENDIIDFYVTEKIVSAYLAGCIPIYYGNNYVNTLFKADTFIDLNVSLSATAMNIPVMGTIYDAMTEYARSNIFNKTEVWNDVWSRFQHTDDFYAEKYNLSPLPLIKDQCYHGIAPIDKKWLYLKNPKTGSTSGLNILSRVEGRLIDMTAKSVRQYRDACSFIVIREPVSRFISGYFTAKNRIGFETNNDGHHIKMLLQNAIHNGSGVWYEPTCHWAHVAPQSHLLQRFPYNIALVMPMVSNITVTWNHISRICKLNVDKISHLNQHEGGTKKTEEALKNQLLHDNEFLLLFHEAFRDDILVWNESVRMHPQT